jgi:hypothetical protein
MPPAARNPFVKGFLDLPKLFIRYFSLLYPLALLRVSSRFTKIGGGFRIPLKSRILFTATRYTEVTFGTGARFSHSHVGVNLVFTL